MHTRATEGTAAGTATGETWTGPGLHGPGRLPAGGLPLPQAAGRHLCTGKLLYLLWPVAGPHCFTPTCHCNDDYHDICGQECPQRNVMGGTNGQCHSLQAGIAAPPQGVSQRVAATPQPALAESTAWSPPC